MTVPGTRTLSPLGNFAALGASEVAARFIGFYATALLARKLGVDAFGVLGFATALMSYFGIALTVGFGDIGAREVARDPSAARRLAADATGIRLLIAVAGIASIAFISFAVISSAIHRTVLLVGMMVLVSLALDTSWVYRGLSRNRTAGLALLLAQSAYLAGVIVLVSSPKDVVRVPLIQFAGDMLAAFMLLGLLFGRTIPRPSLIGGMALLRQSGFITVSRLLRALIVTFDILLLALLASNSDVGLYTAAYRVCLLVTTIAMATHVVFLPGLVESAAAGPERVTTVMSRSLSLTSAVIIPLVVGGIVLAEPLLAFLFGAEYGAAAVAFQLLLASIGVLAIHGIAHNVFVAMHQTGREAVIFGAAAIVNIGLNVILIPRYGLIGAAFATLAAETFILIANAVVLIRSGLKPALSRMVLPLAASAVMGVALFPLAGRLPVWALVPLGGLVYLVVFGATGGIRRELEESRIGMLARRP
ncbi:MAG: flippase [Gemmatimonadaceae bacterium]|nr:flippase [Gemmatimonadaceae bacterium]